jgi:hypothetical protein
MVIGEKFSITPSEVAHNHLGINRLEVHFHIQGWAAGPCVTQNPFGRLRPDAPSLKTAIAHLKKAVAVQDTLKYGEPPDWYFPVRESLGAALLMNGDAAAAERVFREDLNRNPRNPRSLFGLVESLRKQARTYDAGFVESQFRDAWKGSSLNLEDLV